MVFKFFKTVILNLCQISDNLQMNFTYRLLENLKEVEFIFHLKQYLERRFN